MKKIGFIGSGNMAKALIQGILSSGKFTPDELIVSAKSQETLDKIKNQFQVEGVLDNRQVVQSANTIILAIKPGQFEKVIPEISQDVNSSKLIISIASGRSIDQILQLFGKDVRLIRTMPNTPALVGEGMTGIFPSKSVSPEDVSTAEEIFQCVGKTKVLDESLVDAVIGLSGSSPAYIFMLIEAMGDAGVLGGMPRESAYLFAAQAILGSAKLFLETGIHPGELKDRVCSPGGNTIEAVKVLEKEGFRNSIIQAMEAAMNKTKKM